MEAKKANLFIVGAMKAGTTSFAHVLSQHPEIFFSPIKEPHFFVDPLPKQFMETSRFFSLEDYFKNKYPAPLHRAQIMDAVQYQHLFLNANTEKYLAEASTSYLHAPEAAKRIFNYNPKAKIIILTREPLQRAFSHYTMNLGLGRERKSFAAVMSRELELYKQGTLPWYSYLNMSCYQKPIRIYRETFSEVLILSFEDLTQNTAAELEKVARFLAISKFPDFSFPHLNEGRSFKSQKVFYLLKKLGLKDFFSRYINPKTKKQILHRVSSKTISPLDLPEMLRNELEEVFYKPLTPERETDPSR